MEKDNNSNTNEKHQFSILRFRWVVESVLNLRRTYKFIKIFTFFFINLPQKRYLHEFYSRSIHWDTIFFVGIIYNVNNY